MHLKQPGFTCHLQKAKKGHKNSKKQEIYDIYIYIYIYMYIYVCIYIYIYQNGLHKACFQRDMVYGDFKNLNIC